jgi:hypothetical protein
MTHHYISAQYDLSVIKQCGRTKKKPAQPKPLQYSRCRYDPYCLSTQGATFHQNIGAQIIPDFLVVPAFPGRSGHGIVSCSAVAFDVVHALAVI